MMTGRINKHWTKIALERIKRAIEEKKIKPTSKADNEANPKKDGKFI